MWPERSDSEAGSSLRRALWRLNREAPGLVERHNQQVSLSREVQVDLREVTRMADAVQDGALRGSPVAVRLLEGDLLPQWSFDWIDIHREAFRQVRLHALEGLARNDLDADRPASALASALAAVGIDPLRESAHRIVIAVHLAEGNAAEAVRHYTTYRDLLWKELRLRPGRQLQTMLPVGPGLPPVRPEARRRSPQA
jgi:DNA-binding SARP family transcriptional activator